MGQVDEFSAVRPSSLPPGGTQGGVRKLFCIVRDRDLLAWMYGQSFGANRCQNDNLKSKRGNGEDNIEDGRDLREKVLRACNGHYFRGKRVSSTLNRGKI
jgi:hypothetical protein